jgi:hypothetical protein
MVFVRTGRERLSRGGLFFSPAVRPKSNCMRLDRRRMSRRVTMRINPTSDAMVAPIIALLFRPEPFGEETRPFEGPLILGRGVVGRSRGMLLAVEVGFTLDAKVREKVVLEEDDVALDEDEVVLEDDETNLEETAASIFARIEFVTGRLAEDVECRPVTWDVDRSNDCWSELLSAGGILATRSGSWPVKPLVWTAFKEIYIIKRDTD